MKKLVLLLLATLALNSKALGSQRVAVIVSGSKAIETLGHRIVPTQYDQRHLDEIRHFFENTKSRVDIISKPEIRAMNAKDYDVLIIPDSPLVLSDLASSSDLGDVLKLFAKENKTIVAIGHGTAGLLSTMDNVVRFLDVMVQTKMIKLNYHFPREEMPQLVLEQKHLARNWVFSGMRVTGYSKVEDQMDENRGRLMFYTEEALDRAGANFKKKHGPVQNVVVDRNLITAQNSKSTSEALKLIPQVR